MGTHHPAYSHPVQAQDAHSAVLVRRVQQNPLIPSHAAAPASGIPQKGPCFQAATFSLHKPQQTVLHFSNLASKGPSSSLQLHLWRPPMKMEVW